MCRVVSPSLPVVTCAVRLRQEFRICREGVCGLVSSAELFFPRRSVMPTFAAGGETPTLKREKEEKKSKE